MNFEISPTIILMTLAGSHSYGTSGPESDIDVRGICVAPFDVRISFNRFEQYEGIWEDGMTKLSCDFNHKRFSEVSEEYEHIPEDIVIYDIAKAMKLIGECNPNMLELLFCDDNDYLFKSQMGEKLIAQRQKFVTLKAKHTYTGYATAQLKKIERHRAYLLGDIPEKPTRASYGLPEHESLIPQAEQNLINEEVQNRIRTWSADNIELGAAERITLNENLRSFMCAALKVEDTELDDQLEDTAANSLGFNQEVRDILRKERGFRNALKSYKSYQSWSKGRNPKRKALEEKHGYDSKHASHLIRLARSGIEILRDGQLTVRRDDAEELLSIRRGEKPFGEIKVEAEALFEEMNHFYKENPQKLPHKVDSKYLDNLTREIIVMSLK